ncbi:MAG: TSUP family transporter, partial [Phycisphaerae bacterium]
MLLLLLELVGVGLVAGIAGGMLGIGGGLVMIPALLFLRGDVDGPNAIHLYKLAAIMTSIAIVLPAAIRHAKTGALQVPRSNAMRLPATSAMIVGVILSYFLAGPLTIVLRRTFGVAMIAAVLFQIWQHARRTRHPADAAPRRLAAAASTGCELAARQERKLVVTTAAPAGFLAGFLGIGGGAWAVPIQSMGFHVPLRSAIANSTALIAWIAPWTAVVQGIAVRA